jgi:DNA-binding NarL/FixJ family response regulator
MGKTPFCKQWRICPILFLMDVNLEGGREGIEAGRWLREVCNVPVVFITAYTDRDTVERILEQVPGALSQSHSIASALLAQ